MTHNHLQKHPKTIINPTLHLPNSLIFFHFWNFLPLPAAAGHAAVVAGKPPGLRRARPGGRGSQVSFAWVAIGGRKFTLSYVGGMISSLMLWEIVGIWPSKVSSKGIIEFFFSF